jgi:hypothetical protein
LPQSNLSKHDDKTKEDKQMKRPIAAYLAMFVTGCLIVSLSIPSFVFLIKTQLSSLAEESTNNVVAKSKAIIEVMCEDSVVYLSSQNDSKTVKATATFLDLEDEEANRNIWWYGTGPDEGYEFLSSSLKDTQDAKHLSSFKSGTAVSISIIGMETEQDEYVLSFNLKADFDHSITTGFSIVVEYAENLAYEL